MSNASDHEHITVDEETYWGLLYLHYAVRASIDGGEAVPRNIVLHYEEAERRLERTRKMLQDDPDHHTKGAK